jgi:high affinity Mn2+ porin
MSGDARAYFVAGGGGILIGDGRLDYGSERIVEAYYSWQVAKPLALTFDYQHVGHPAYNRDRGPVAIYTFRARDAW